MKHKIVHIITRLDKGGSAENVIISCRKTNSAAYETLLIYGSTVNPALSINIPVVHVPTLVRNISLLKDIRAFLSIYMILRKEKPAIVHTHSSKGGFLGRWAAWLYNRFKSENDRAAIIHTPHGHVFYGYGFSQAKAYLYVMIERITARITDILIALTNGEMQESLDYGVGKPAQWRIVHSAVGIPPRQEGERALVRRQFNIPDDALVVGTVARLETVKGIGDFIEAIHELQQVRLSDPVYYLIVGGGALLEELSARAQRYGIKDRVLFTDMQDDVFRFMAIMNVYVQPSLNEGMGKTIVQAQLMGLPVIATRVQGIPDVIVDNETGILVPPRNPKKLALAILNLIQNRERSVAMGEAASIWIRQTIDGHPRFSTERMLVLLEKIYAEALQ